MTIGPLEIRLAHLADEIESTYSGELVQLSGLPSEVKNAVTRLLKAAEMDTQSALDLARNYKR